MSMLVPAKEMCFLPWSGFRALEKELDRIFGGEHPISSGTWAPAVDFHESKDAYVIEADLPGLKREDIEVTVVNDVVTLKGERKSESEQKEGGYHCVERRYGRFERSFRLPSGVDTTKVTAHFEQGVLKVTLPKPETAKPKQIEVQMN